MNPAQTVVIDAVQELRDERDELLDLLRTVAEYADSGIPADVLDEIHRRLN